MKLQRPQFNSGRRHVSLDPTGIKLCYRCKEAKPLCDFNKARSRSDGVQSRCRACDQEIGRAAYAANPGRFRRNATAARNTARNAIWTYLLKNPCIDCGLRDPLCLDFDHRDPSLKDLNVSAMVGGGYSLARIMTEVAKCDVRCANCHRRRTAAQFGWWADLHAPLEEVG